MIKLPNTLVEVLACENVPQELKEFIKELCNTDSEFAMGYHPSLDFSYYFGGDFFIVETEEDFKSIRDATHFSLPLAPPITERVGSFDIFELICEDSFIHIFLASNNSGGDSYFVPIELANKFPFTAETVEAHKA